MILLHIVEISVKNIFDKHSQIIIYSVFNYKYLYMKSLSKQNQFSEILIYKTPQGKVKVEVLIHDENLRLTQQKMADLFGVQQPAIAKHLKNIFETWELVEKSVHSILEYTANDNKKYKTKFYNLDAIIAVGYRVNSKQATQFRIRATERLKEYIIKWFTMDDERLRNPEYIFWKDYFEEQLSRIRDIRSSERRFYQKITDIYAQCSADYDPNSETTKLFFATVQNKLHRAITGQTASEIIHSRVDSNKPNMWLTNRKNWPGGKIRKSDISIAKNYLNKNELDILNRIITMYLDYAELQAKKYKLMYMEDRIVKLDSFLQFNEQEILQDNWKISHEIAVSLAEKEFKKFMIKQDKKYISDFDREIKGILPHIK